MSKQYVFDDIEDEDDERFERDFFGRAKSKDYTYSNERSRFSRFSDNFGTMSESFFGTNFNKRKNQLAPVLSVAKTMLKMVGAKPNHKGKFEFVNKTDKRDLTKVKLPMDMIIDHKKSKPEDKKVVYDLDPQKVDAFLGGTIENASLKRYQTNVEFEQTEKDKDPKSTDAFKFLRATLNTERVDKKLSEDYPGYNRFIQKYKNNLYESNYEAVPEDPDNPGAKLLDVATRLIRFPSSITEEEMSKYETEIQYFKKIFEKFGSEIPDTWEECSEIAQEVSQYIHLKEQEADEQNGEGEGEGEGKADDLAKKLSKSLFEDKDEKMSQAAISDMGEAEKQAAEEDAEKNLQYDENAENADSNVHFRDAEDDKYKYNEVLSQIDLARASALRQLFKRKSKDLKFVIKGMKSGRFDTNKLAEAKQHVPTVYERIGEVKTDKIAVGLLIDESGSMSGSSIRMAQQAAIMLNEIFKGQTDIELFIYGHTANDNHRGDSTEIIVYREPGKEMKKYALGSVHAKSNNRDGHAIFAVGNRIRRFSKNPAILMVLSDGAPAASNYYNGVEDTKQKVKKVERLGFQVIQIAINNHVPSDKMFTHFVVMDNIASLPKNLTSYMSRKVNTLIKEHVTC